MDILNAERLITGNKLARSLCEDVAKRMAYQMLCAASYGYSRFAHCR
jgi:hypothetical protein